MVICGIKLTHDGAVALIDDNKLVFCVEVEKEDNNPRFSEILDTRFVERQLARHGYSLRDVDVFAIDGWEGLHNSSVTARTDNKVQVVPVAPYRELKLSQNVLAEYKFKGLRIGDQSVDYSSYMHAAGHIAGAYCCSPFAALGESAYVLVWDGGMFPRLYYFEVSTRQLHNLGKLFYLIGNVYSEFAKHFEPFRQQVKPGQRDLSVAGKVMAYIAKGKPSAEIIQELEQILEQHLKLSMDFVHEFAGIFRQRNQASGFRDEDVIASFHLFLEQKLLHHLAEKVHKYPHFERNIVLTGGCALNIKWNSAIRNSGIVKEVWVPPFPNDSGSAIGTACCAMLSSTGSFALSWNVYSGNALTDSNVSDGWDACPYPAEELASLLYHVQEPVVLLNGRAELGPRALGNRSIIAPATDPSMKDILNVAKNREGYRPVAPVCLEEDAPAVFDPGTPDPYMLFDHLVRPHWRDKVPAICHLDDTARLQTVNYADNPLLYTIIREYKQLSGIPLLCNTSANFNGRGFFPDAQSAMQWGRLNFVWSNHILYFKQEYRLLVERNQRIAIGRG